MGEPSSANRIEHYRLMQSRTVGARSWASHFHNLFDLVRPKGAGGLG